MCDGEHVTAHLWRPGDSLKSGFPLDYCKGPSDQTQVFFRLGSKHLQPLGPLPRPLFVFKYMIEVWAGLGKH